MQRGPCVEAERGGFTNWLFLWTSGGENLSKRKYNLILYTVEGHVQLSSIGFTEISLELNSFHWFSQQKRDESPQAMKTSDPKTPIASLQSMDLADSMNPDELLQVSSEAREWGNLEWEYVCVEQHAAWVPRHLAQWSTSLCCQMNDGVFWYAGMPGGVLVGSERLLLFMAIGGSTPWLYSHSCKMGTATVVSCFVTLFSTNGFCLHFLLMGVWF